MRRRRRRSPEMARFTFVLVCWRTVNSAKSLCLKPYTAGLSEVVHKSPDCWSVCQQVLSKGRPTKNFRVRERDHEPIAGKGAVFGVSHNLFNIVRIMSGERPPGTQRDRTQER